MKDYVSTNSFIAGFMLGILSAGAWFLSDTLIPMPSPSVPATDTVVSTKSGSVSVVDQRAGSEVIVESVTVPPPGVWVAVREMNGGELGNVLGAVRVSGPRTNVSVSLLRATDPDRRYAVQLYRDDGSGVFDVATDSVYVDFDTGARVVAYFTTMK